MNRPGGFLMLLMTALAVFAVVYLLLGDSMGSGTGGGGRAEGGGGSGGTSYLDAPPTKLEAAGKKPKSAAEIAAEAAAEAEKNRVKPEEGVFGSVSDGRGEPVEGATVRLFDDPPELRHKAGMPDGEPIAMAVTAKDGTFVVGPSPETGYAKVRAEAKGFAPTVQRVRRRGARVDMILDRGGRLEIRTLDEEGEAVAGAQVIHTAGTVVTAMNTDEEGLAKFDALPTGTGGLIILKEGYGSVRDGNLAVAPGETEQRTIVLPKPLEISGMVVDTDTERPVPGAKVTVRYTQLPMLEEGEGVATDEEGRFKLRAWAGGNEQMIVRVTKEGYAEARPWRNAQNKGDMTIKLRKAGEAVEGRVVTASRQPAADVRITYAAMQAEQQADVPSAVSDEDGSFTIDLPAWAVPGNNFTVVGISETAGVGVSYVRIPQKKDARSIQSIELTLGGVGSVAGKVTDAGGAPVQGAVVSLAPDWAAAQNRPGQKRFSWQLLNLLNTGLHHNLTGLSGADGTYEIRDVPAMDYKATATFGLERFTLPSAVQIRDAEKAEADIALGEGGTIEGVVLDSEEKPVAGAYVSANQVQRNNQYGWWMNRPTARSQSDGKFVLRGVSDQRYNVWAYAAGYGNVQEKNVSSGHKDIVLRLKARGWIQGVVQQDGTPYRGTFTVLAVPVSKNSNNPGFNNMGGWRSGQQQRTFNTDDGRFLIKGVNAGDYTVQATTTDGMLAVQPDVVTVMDGRGSRDAMLELEMGAVVTGTVSNDETGKPLNGIWVYATPKPTPGTTTSAPQVYGQTDGQGHYVIRGLGTSTYLITAYAGSSPIQQQIDVRTGERRQVNLTKLRPGSIQFIVTDEEGAPIGGARTQIRTATGNWVGLNIQAMQKEGLIGSTYNWNELSNTGEDGTLMRYHIPPGVLTVWATKRGYKIVGQNPQVEVASGRVTQVEIKLKKQ